MTNDDRSCLVAYTPVFMMSPGPRLNSQLGQYRKTFLYYLDLGGCDTVILSDFHNTSVLVTWGIQNIYYIIYKGQQNIN